MPFEYGKVVVTQYFREAGIRTSYYNEETIFCDASRPLYEDYYTRQSGGEVPVFYGARTQRGHGLASILGELFRRALPFLSSGAKILDQQAMNVASDMIDGKSFQD